MDFLLLSANETLETLNNVEEGLSSLNNSAFSLYGIFLSLASIFGIGVSALVVILSVAASVLGFLWGIFEYLLPAIALFKLAKKAGYKYPWLAFIPVAQTYLEFVIPRREFKLLFTTRKRNVVGIVTIILTYFGTTVIVLLNVVPAIGQLLDLLLPIILILLNWRRRYDMIRTFRDKELATAISILSI
ncbi:MAG: hypothetical protein K6G75_12605, partial [Lachnospiraceae bacterium]|nr:hypothetical protein [Lachnospiraceae bacterium]